jgi:hypothetical protein
MADASKPVAQGISTKHYRPLGSQARPEASMSFILGILLFVVVAGRLDARLPWPSATKNTP